jgi:ubiquinone/menaquinone biosynthesis C-methylase UbiE
MPGLTEGEIKAANVRFHDEAAAGYDAKWGISYGERGRRQVVGKLAKALGEEPTPVGRGLEIGAGTGYFGLNLVRAGLVGELTATDVSEGMLDALVSSAERLGIEGVGTERCEATELPFPDDSFDLVFGHAVPHHLPDLEGSFGEFRRVLRPGGLLAFCGEPSLHGDRLAELPKRAALAVAPLWRRLVGAGERTYTNGDGELDDHGKLEQVVDVHAFTPADLARAAGSAGCGEVRVTGEELAASWFGWANRSLESTAAPDDVPRLWHQYAYRGYLALQAVDRAVLEPRLPAAIFYNLLVSARAPS